MLLVPPTAATIWSVEHALCFGSPVISFGSQSTLRIGSGAVSVPHYFQVSATSPEGR